jgi:uncharacterized membrane protein (DUF485 family)
MKNLHSEIIPYLKVSFAGMLTLLAAHFIYKAGKLVKAMMATGAIDDVSIVTGIVGGVLLIIVGWILEEMRKKNNLAEIAAKILLNITDLFTSHLKSKD